MVQCTQPSLCPDRLVKLDLPFFFHRNRTQRYWGQTLQQNSGAVTCSPALSMRLAAFWSLMPPKKRRLFQIMTAEIWLRLKPQQHKCGCCQCVMKFCTWSMLPSKGASRNCTHAPLRLTAASKTIKICQFVFLGSHHKCYSICLGLHQIIWIHEFVHMNKLTK